MKIKRGQIRYNIFKISRHRNELLTESKILYEILCKSRCPRSDTRHAEPVYIQSFVIRDCEIYSNLVFRRLDF